MLSQYFWHLFFSKVSLSICQDCADVGLEISRKRLVSALSHHFSVWSVFWKIYRHLSLWKIVRYMQDGITNKFWWQYRNIFWYFGKKLRTPKIMFYNNQQWSFWAFFVYAKSIMKKYAKIANGRGLSLVQCYFIPKWLFYLLIIDS